MITYTVFITAHTPYVCLHNLFFVFRIQVGDFIYEYNLITGFVPLSNSNKIVAVAIVYNASPRILQVKGRSTVKLKFLTSIQYSEPITMEEYHVHNELTKNKAIEVRTLYKIRITLFLYSNFVLYICYRELNMQSA